MSTPPPPGQPSVAPPATDPALPSGTIIAERYEIVDVLGQGGFATVYRARQRHIDREVALKILDVGTRRERASFTARFLTEAQAAARLRHPNVVTVFDFGVVADDAPEGGQPYIAMELLEGIDLDEELARRGALSPARTLKLFDGVLGAVAHAHERGIVHKDLKPANLFLMRPGTPDERLVVLDFGVARIGLEEDRLTRSGHVSGTPQYLSPEYIEHQIVSPALDVYQAGLALAETLTGRPAVTAESLFRCCIIHCTGQLDVPERLTASPLGPVLDGALAIDPEARFEHAGAFRNALADVDPAQLPSFEGQHVPSSVDVAVIDDTAEAEVPFSLSAQLGETADAIEPPDGAPSAQRADTGEPRASERGARHHEAAPVAAGAPLGTDETALDAAPVPRMDERPPARQTRAPHASRRHWILIGILAPVVVALGAAGVVYVSGSDSEEVADTPPEPPGSLESTDDTPVPDPPRDGVQTPTPPDPMTPPGANDVPASARGPEGTDRPAGHHLGPTGAESSTPLTPGAASNETQRTEEERDGRRDHAAQNHAEHDRARGTEGAERDDSDPTERREAHGDHGARESDVDRESDRDRAPENDPDPESDDDGSFMFAP